MPTIPEDLAAVRADLRLLADRAAISDLIDRYVITLDVLDERGYDDDWYRSIFTEDVRLTFPIGEHHGVPGLAAFQAGAKAKFARTHHLSGNHVIGLAGDRASVRAQLVAAHVHLPATLTRRGPAAAELFGIGGYYEAEAVRTPAGWRFERLTFHLVWSVGEGPPQTV